MDTGWLEIANPVFQTSQHHPLRENRKKKNEMENIKKIFLLKTANGNFFHTDILENDEVNEFTKMLIDSTKSFICVFDLTGSALFLNKSHVIYSKLLSTYDEAIFAEDLTREEKQYLNCTDIELR